ncbi:hypothetical protein PV371_02415 [Streptomyces sp. TX20-6-3]|uniref:hypothetical protein n=1 Tax=Streptomyces sp. TX20-6-3 TaxID=3028705 RepID=UPI0029B726E3|nr:hypothetical protein [Streptomyces sp. TX20-6-3]MDX2558508.1 hypothetical protein [Streptomyces sp. TX20-6-3]
MSFSFTNPTPDNEPTFSFTRPELPTIDEHLQAIADMAHETLRLVAELRRQTNT